MGTPASDYDTIHSAFSWNVPRTFNFATDVVDVWAEEPTRTALIWSNSRGESATLTYAAIAEQSRQFAQVLLHHGISKGERVLVMLPRVPEWQITLVACLRIGAVPVPCITMLTSDDIAHRVHHSGAAAVVTTDAETHKFNRLERPAVRVAVGARVEGWVPFDEMHDQPRSGTGGAVVDARDPAIMYYTSGSSGEAKGVVHKSEALFAWRVSAEYWLSLRPGDVIWCTADTGWSKAGTSIIFGPWSMGAAAVFYDGPFAPAQRFQLLRANRVNVFCASATELRRLMVELEPTELPDLRLTVSAGESVNPEIIERWKALTGTDVLDGYGQTETLMTVTNMPGLPVKPGSMGRPLPGVTAGVLTSQGSVRQRGGAGQLVIRAPSPQLMLGYHQDEARTAESYTTDDETSWFLTGDNVDVDEEGYFYYVGRSDDIINSSGYRIGPQEVENALTSHPAVQECAVVGAPDADRGEIVVAFVVPAPGVVADHPLAESLQQHVKNATAPYKYPRLVHFTEELPKTVTGKIRRNELRKRLHSEPATD